MCFNQCGAYESGATCDLNNATADGSPGSTLKQKIGYKHLAVEVRVNDLTLI